MPIEIQDEAGLELFQTSVSVELTSLLVHRNRVLDVQTTSCSVGTSEKPRIVYLAQITYEPKKYIR